MPTCFFGQHEQSWLLSCEDSSQAMLCVLIGAINAAATFFKIATSPLFVKKNLIS
jgi:hypothetical protein